MAEGAPPEAGCGNPTDQAQQLIYGAGNLEYQMNQFIQSGGQAVKILSSGKTGVGKSHLTNALIGEDLAEEGEDVDPQTDEVTAYEFTKNEVNITVYDTPGLADATGKDEEYLRKIQAKERTFDLFLFCTELNTIRFRNDDLETMKKLTTTMGWQLWDHAVVVLTFANEVRRSPSKKAKDLKDVSDAVSEKDFFNNRFRGFKRKIQEALIQVGVPADAVMKVSFVPAGDLGDPRLPDRDNWLTAFWVAAFKRINRNAKAAFLVANADRIAFSRVFTDDEYNLASAEGNEDEGGLPSSHLSAEDAQAIRVLQQKLQETSFAKELDTCLLKPRVYDEAGKKSDQAVRKVSAFIEMDESSSQDLIKEMVGDITGNMIGELTTPAFGRFYQTFFGWIVNYLKKVFQPSPGKPRRAAIMDKPANEEHEDCGEESSETEKETEVE